MPMSPEDGMRGRPWQHPLTTALYHPTATISRAWLKRPFVPTSLTREARGNYLEGSCHSKDLAWEILSISHRHISLLQNKGPRARTILCSWNFLTVRRQFPEDRYQITLPGKTHPITLDIINRDHIKICQDENDNTKSLKIKLRSSPQSWKQARTYMLNINRVTAC